jgi:hypothetical protein
MRDLLNQIQGAVNGHAYYLALYACLTIPDICGAMESDDGQATKSKYIAWFDKYVAPKYFACGQATLTGEACYIYRCAVLHQGRAQHPKLGFSRILFVEPGATTNVFHNNVLNDALNINASIFCSDVLAGANAWLQAAEKSPNYQKNFPLFMQRYPSGLPPYIVGVPVIA